MTREPSRQVVGWLLLAVIALIAYGSLYPFNLRSDPFEGGLWRALNLLSWQRAGRADRISNVLLYLPLGFLLFLAFVPRVSRFAALAIATLLGAAVSVAIEFTQIWISSRVPSLTDVTLNALGALLGALGGVGWRGLSNLMQTPAHAEKPTRDPSAALVLALFLLWRFAPFVPELDLGKLKSALQPLIRPQFDPTAVFIFLTCWLVVNQLTAVLLGRARRLEGLLIVIAAVLVGRLLVANQTFVPSELFALLLLLPLIVLMHRLKPRPRRAALVIAVATVMIIEGLAPFDFVAHAPRLELWPFKAWLGGGLPHAVSSIDWVQLFGTLFFYAALIWVVREWGAPIQLAAGAAVVFVVLIEAAQMWLPDEHASITQPLAAVGVAWAMRALSRSKRSLLRR